MPFVLLGELTIDILLPRFGLESKIIATISDNGSDIRAATQQTKIFGTRMHCLAHGLNLTLQNGLGLWQKPKTKETAHSRSARYDIETHT
jgi:hypothetical protein